jgi:hypothetical protein
MTTEATRAEGWWRALMTAPTRILTALADGTRDWRRGCGL